jgi:hypothetical protein
MLTHFEISEGYSEFPKEEQEGLLQGVDAVLKTWSKTASRQNSAPAEKTEPRFIEFSVRFLGRFFGILTVRTTADLVKAFLCSSDGVSVRQLSEEEALKGFAAVLIGRLMAYLWEKNWGLFVSETPRFSTLGSWCDSKTLACGAFVVKKWPVEVRISTEKLVSRSQVMQFTKNVLLEMEKRHA